MYLFNIVSDLVVGKDKLEDGRLWRSTLLLQARNGFLDHDRVGRVSWSNLGDFWGFNLGWFWCLWDLWGLGLVGSDGDDWSSFSGHSRERSVKNTNGRTLVALAYQAGWRTHCYQPARSLQLSHHDHHWWLDFARSLIDYWLRSQPMSIKLPGFNREHL